MNLFYILTLSPTNILLFIFKKMRTHRQAR